MSPKLSGNCPETPLLDKYVHNREFKLVLKLEISGREYVLMLIFYWICTGL